MPSTRRLNLTPFLMSGLAVDARLTKNVPGLQECKNLVVRGGKLMQAEPAFSADQTAAVEMDWPFPQVFKGHSSFYLAYDVALYSLSESWVPTEILTYDPASPSTLKPLGGGGAWHFGEFGNCTAFWNGFEVVVAKTDIDTGVRKYFAYTDFIAHTGCFVEGRGQCVTGRLENVAGGNPAWYDYWETLANSISGSVNLALDSDLNRAVWWSSIGGGDVTALFEDPSTREGFEAQALRAESGYTKMPWSGDVLAVKQLGKFVIVYGENGITALNPVSVPMNTYGQIHVAGFGIMERSAVGGDLAIHSFVDVEGYIWTLDAQLALTRKGYKQFMEDSRDDAELGPLMVSYDPGENEFYYAYSDAAGDTPKAYILSSGGLSRVEQVLSSVQTAPALFDTRLVGMFQGVRSDYEDQAFEVVTNPFDMGVRAIKSLETIEVNTDNVTSLQVRVAARNGSSDAFVQGPWINCAPDGSAFPTSSGVEFQVGIKGSLSSLANVNSTVDSLEVDWMRIDSRNVRGPV